MQVQPTPKGRIMKYCKMIPAMAMAALVFSAAPARAADDVNCDGTDLCGGTIDCEACDTKLEETCGLPGNGGKVVCGTCKPKPPSKCKKKKLTYKCEPQAKKEGAIDGFIKTPTLSGTTGTGTSGSRLSNAILLAEFCLEDDEVGAAVGTPTTATVR